MKTPTAATIALAASLLAFTPATAAEPRSAVVSYADLDLSGKAGQAILDRRIEHAIETVCGRMQGKPTFDGPVRECQTDTRAIARKSRDLAVADYGSKRLAAKDRTIRLVAR